MLREVYREASWKAKVLVFSFLFVMVGSIIGSPVLLYKAYRNQSGYRYQHVASMGELRLNRRNYFLLKVFA